MKDKGFVVLGFPCNDFGGQEPGAAAEIRKCGEKYKATFPVMEKIVVKAGAGQSPIYANLAKQAKGELPNWNFCKYLVHKNGKVIKFYKNNVKPEDADLRKEIDAALAQK